MKLKFNPLDDFSNLRKIKKFKGVLNFVLSISLLIISNSISSNFYKRFDLTENKRYTLNAETKAHVRNLDQDTMIAVLFPRNSAQPEFEQIQSHIGHLLTSYEAESINNGSGYLRVQYIDPFRQRIKAQEIYNKYNIKDENILLIAQGDRSQIIRPADLFSVENNTINGFKGESAITSALINVNSKKTQTIYFLQGHGEKNINDNDPLNGISLLTTFLENKNFKIKELNLLRENRIPKDASLIIIASPQGPLEAFEVEILRRYLSDENGRMLILLDPGRIHGLNSLFLDWGILAENKIIFGSTQSFVANSEDFVINQFSDHPINEIIIDYNLNPIIGQPRPIIADPLSINNKRLTVTEIAGTGSTTWIENNYKSGISQSYQPEEDTKGPISIAAVSNLSQTSSLGISIPTGRLAVFGNSTFIGNNHFQIFGNQILLYNTINWLVDRIHFLNIPIKPIETYQITIDLGDMNKLLFYYSLLPLAIAISGSLILYMRKR